MMKLRAQNCPPPRNGSLNNSFTGFTLAEVLITLGIIGVVAAVTMPVLQAKYFEKMAVSKFKQTYSILANAIHLMIEEEGCESTSCYANVAKPDIQTITDKIDKHFKYTDKVCRKYGEKPKEIPWLPEFAYALNGKNINYATYIVTWRSVNDDSDVCCYKMNNGSTVSFSRMNAFNDSGTGASILNIAIDVNGKQGPNRIGKDIFPVSSSTRTKNQELSPYYAVHDFAVEDFWAGLCRKSWSVCDKPDETSPAAYIMAFDKLPNLEKAGFPAKP